LVAGVADVLTEAAAGLGAIEAEHRCGALVVVAATRPADALIVSEVLVLGISSVEVLVADLGQIAPVRELPQGAVLVVLADT
jgi:hypothetical protein